jgi:nucleoside-diphosphate-sugar epimerase
MGYHLMIEAMLDGRPITVFGDGRQSRSNTYVDDCVAGTIAALEGAHESTMYNIGGGDEIDVLGVLATLGEALGATPEIRFAPPRPGDQRRTRADFERARRDFGFQPSVSVRDGLHRQAAWHLQLRPGAAGAPDRPTHP